MSIKAIGFDVGHTLVSYKNPLNWSSLYKPALTKMLKDCNLECSDNRIEQAIIILSKFNTRINYREVEYSSDIIFQEIFDKWNEDKTNLEGAVKSFYSFFQANAKTFDEVEPVLRKIKEQGIKIGIFTNVAYGMDNKYSKADVQNIEKYIDIYLSSIDIGFRKPDKTGFLRLLEYFKVLPKEMIFVGDEEADIVGANNSGIYSVLINRTDKYLNYGQQYTISSLEELTDIVNTHEG